MRMRLSLAVFAVAVCGCATEPHDVAIFSHSADYWAGILVGAKPSRCLFVDAAHDQRTYMACDGVAAYVRDHLHAPAGAKLLVVPRAAGDWPMWKALNASLTAAGFSPGL
jgi:hypothetical protein